VATCSGSGQFSFVGGTNGNVAGGANSGVLSGYGNEACDDAAGIGTGAYNSVSGGKANWSFIGAGLYNDISQTLSFIGGGFENTVSAQIAVIGGGANNTISVGGSESVIGGGDGNKVQAGNATVAGGISNQALGLDASVPGGDGNIASGAVSFAAGTASFAAHSGAFVWSDNASGAYQLKSSGANQFLARASGGVVFYTNPTLTTGAILHAGSGTLASASDRALKTNVEPIDDTAILDRVAAMPISKWSYISEHGVRHVGPMAQDFYAAFGLGEDDKHITSIDEEGVAYAAIQALQGRLQNLKAIALRAAAMRQAHLRNQATIAALHRREAALESQLRSLR